MYDVGSYNKNPDEYSKIIEELYVKYPNGITLTPEYADFVNGNLTQFLIRLSRYKFATKMMRKSDHVLEVGSGSGLGSIYLSQHCKTVTGIDVKKVEVEEARKINTRANAEFIHGDFYELDAKKTFDSIVSLDVIEHMSMEDGNKFVKKIAQHLNDTGMMIIGSPSIYSYEYQSPASKASHIKCYDQQELVGLVEQYFGRAVVFSMNDEVVHTGHPKMAWYYFVLAFYPKK